MSLFLKMTREIFPRMMKLPGYGSNRMEWTLAESFILGARKIFGKWQRPDLAVRAARSTSIAGRVAVIAKANPGMYAV